MQSHNSTDTLQLVTRMSCPQLSSRTFLTMKSLSPKPSRRKGDSGPMSGTCRISPDVFIFIIYNKDKVLVHK